MKEVCSFVSMFIVNQCVLCILSLGIVSTAVGSKNHKDSVHIWLEKAKKYSVAQKPDSAMFYANKVLEVDTLDLHRRLNALRVLGLAYSDSSHYSSALIHLKKSLELSVMHGYDDDEQALCNDIGNTYSDLGIMDSSRVFYERALAKAVENKDKTGQLNIILSLSGFNILMHDFESAQEFAGKAVGLLKIKYDLNADVVLTNHLAAISNHTGNYELAKRQTRKLLSSLVANGTISKVPIQYVSSIKMNLGLMYYRTDILDSAKSLFGEVLVIAKETNNVALISNTKMNLARVYAKEKNYDLAKEYMDQAEGLAKQYETINLILIYELQFKLHKILKNYEKALDYLEKSDSIEDHQMRTERLELDKKYNHLFAVKTKNEELAERHKENAALGLQVEKERTKRSYAYVAFLGALAMALLLAVLLAIHKYNKKVLELNNAQLENQLGVKTKEYDNNQSTLEMLKRKLQESAFQLLEERNYELLFHMLILNSRRVIEAIELEELAHMERKLLKDKKSELFKSPGITNTKMFKDKSFLDKYETDLQCLRRIKDYIEQLFKGDPLKKDEQIDNIMTSLKEVHAFIDFRNLLENSDKKLPTESLTNQELVIILLLSIGYSNKEIAGLFGMTETQFQDFLRKNSKKSVGLKLKLGIDQRETQYSETLRNTYFPYIKALMELLSNR